MAIRSAHTLGKFRGTLLLVGAGKMGSAMLDGWLARGLKPKQIVVIEPHPAKTLKAPAKRGLKLNPKSKPAAADAVVIAVKPQTAAEAVPQLGPYIGKTTLVVSIMAGRTIGFLEKSLPPGAAIVRAMPNTPAAIGRGISVAVANARVSTRQRKQASDLLAAIGKVEWVGNEALMDAVTALSGSGPAYVFLLAEAMANAPRAGDRRGFRRTIVSLEPRCGDSAGKRDLSRRHDRCRTGGPHGTERIRANIDARD
jgi:pyrroline-5-carboxylate reductase